MAISTYAQAAPSGTVLTVAGQVDEDSAAAFEELLLKATRAHRPPLLLDLSRIESMDRTGLAALMTIRNLAAARDCRLRVIAASASVRTLLNLTGAEFILDEAQRAAHAPA